MTNQNEIHALELNLIKLSKDHKVKRKIKIWDKSRQSRRVAASQPGKQIVAIQLNRRAQNSNLYNVLGSDYDSESGSYDFKTTRFFNG